MKHLILFLKLQYKLLIALTIMAPVPLFLLLKMDMEIPYLPYFFLIFLFAIKMLAFQATSTSKVLVNLASKSLENELNRKPSKQMIINRAQTIHTGRDIALGICGLAVIFISIFLKAF